MNNFVLILIIVIFISWCPFLHKNRYLLPLYFWGVYCVVAQMSIFGFRPISLRWGMFALLALLGLHWYSIRNRYHADLMLVLPVVFIVLTFLSAMYSQVPTYTMFRSGALLMIFAFIFLGVRSLIDSPESIYNVGVCILATMIFSCIIIAVVGLQQNVHLSTGAYRFQGHAKATGVSHAIAASVPLLFYLRKYPGKFPRWVLLGFTLFLFYILLATRSRFGIGAAILILPASYSALFHRARLRGIITGSLVGFVLMTIVWQYLPQEEARDLLRLQSVEKVLQTRVEDRWDIMWKRALERPFFGWGYGSVRYYYTTDEVNWVFGGGRQEQIMAHNQHLALFYDLGIFGVSMFWLFLIAVFRQGVRVIQLPSGPLRDLLVCVFFSCGVNAMNTMSHDGLLTIGNVSASWFWIKGLLVYYGYPILRANAQRTVSPRRTVPLINRNRPLIPRPQIAIPGRDGLNKSGISH